LRDNFDAKAKWRSAITSARVITRFGNIKLGIEKTGTEDSGGWKDSDDDDEEDTSSNDKGEKKLAGNNPGVNDNVVVTPPVNDKGKVAPAGRFLTSSIASSSRTEQGPRESHSLKREDFHEQLPSEYSSGKSKATPHFKAEEEAEMSMPGSFDLLNPRNGWDTDDAEEEAEKEALKQRSWSDLFKTLILG
jgi:calcium/calmodulin-dependent protein kinase I